MHSLRRCHSKRSLITTRKQVTYELPGIKGGLYGIKRVQRRLFKQDCTPSNRQHHNCCLHKQGRRHEVGSTVCPILANPDLVLQESGDPQSLTHSRPAESGSRQAIQTWLDNSNRVVSPSRGLPVDMHPVASTSNRPFCNEAKQQAALVCVTSSRLPSLGSRCTQSILGGPGHVTSHQ